MESVIIVFGLLIGGAIIVWLLKFIFQMIALWWWAIIPLTIAGFFSIMLYELIIG